MSALESNSRPSAGWLMWVLALLGIGAAVLLAQRPGLSSTAPQITSVHAASVPPARPATPAAEGDTAAPSLSGAQLVQARARGLEHFAARRYTAAAETLAPVYRVDPKDDAVALPLAEALLRIKDLHNADLVLQGLQDRGTLTAVRLRGMLLEARGELDEALALYDAELPGSGEDPALRFRKAQVLSWQREFERARVLYEALAELPAYAVQAPLRLAELTAWEKDLPGALSQLDKLLDQHPELGEAMLLRGQVLEWQGRYVEAKATYGRLLSLERDDTDARTARARLEQLLWVE